MIVDELCSLSTSSADGKGGAETSVGGIYILPAAPGVARAGWAEAAQKLEEVPVVVGSKRNEKIAFAFHGGQGYRWSCVGRGHEEGACQMLVTQIANSVISRWEISIKFSSNSFWISMTFSYRNSAFNPTYVINTKSGSHQANFIAYFRFSWLIPQYTRCMIISVLIDGIHKVILRYPIVAVFSSDTGPPTLQSRKENSLSGISAFF